MILSARNQLEGRIKTVKPGNVMAGITDTVGDIEIVSAITRAAAGSMQPAEGDKVKAVNPQKS